MMMAAGASFKAGSRVDVRFEEDGGALAWYPGVVVESHLVPDGKQDEVAYNVAFDDGDFLSDVVEDEMRPEQTSAATAKTGANPDARFVAGLDVSIDSDIPDPRCAPHESDCSRIVLRSALTERAHAPGGHVYHPRAVTSRSTKALPPGWVGTIKVVPSGPYKLYYGPDDECARSVAHAWRLHNAAVKKKPAEPLVCGSNGGGPYWSFAEEQRLLATYDDILTQSMDEDAWETIAKDFPTRFVAHGISPKRACRMHMNAFARSFASRR